MKWLSSPFEKPVLVLALVASLSGCGNDERLEAPPSLPDPSELGPYPIGVTHLEIDDGQGGERRLPIEVWYPRAPDASAEPYIYKLELGAIILGQLPSPGAALADAPFDESLGPRPTVVFSHGNGGIRTQSYYLTEHLASHGYVVAAPDHTGNTIHAMVDASRALSAIEIARLRPLDVGRTLDAVLAESERDGSPLRGSVDASRVGVAGHSFGGFTAFRIAGASIDTSRYTELCRSGNGGLLCDGWSEGLQFPDSARDERFIAALPQAPGGADIIREGFASVSVPTQIQGGSEDRTTPFEAESVAPYELLPGGAQLMIIDKAGHFSYSNLCEFLDLVGDVSSLFGDVFDDGCGANNIPPAAAHRLANRYATAFFGVELAGLSGYANSLDPASPPAGVERFERR